MRVLVTGAGGLLGSEVVAWGAAHGQDVVGAGHAALDVTDADAVRSAVAERPIDWVVHCAAYTAVDRAESEADRASLVNVRGTEHVARAAAQVGARLAYISTDYVFDGTKRSPYRVTDEPRPLSVYGRTKLAGERAAGRACAEGPSPSPAPLIVRTGWLYGAGGRGFVRAMLERARRGERLSIVDDQTGRPTWARNVARHLFALMERGQEGVWHVADGGAATWLALAREACRVTGVEAEVKGVSTRAWDAPAPRPAYSVLDVEATEHELGRPMQAWESSLAECLTSAVIGHEGIG
jgi:dTDP-4-dehydrorhamnose reductase